jgi:hypothetical protein
MDQEPTWIGQQIAYTKRQPRSVTSQLHFNFTQGHWIVGDSLQGTGELFMLRLAPPFPSIHAAKRDKKWSVRGKVVLVTVKDV